MDQFTALLKKVGAMPRREIVASTLIMIALGIDAWIFNMPRVVIVLAVVATLPTVIAALKSLKEIRISIDTFNVFAFGVAVVLGDAKSTAFIALMLSFARLLDWYTSSTAHSAIEKLLLLKPTLAFIEKSGGLEEVAVESLKVGDVVVVKPGGRIPVDGVIVYGTASVNEASVTGESLPARKIIGDTVLSATLLEDGVIKVRAVKVGKDSTVEQIAVLIEQASTHKSRSEKMADRFAGGFLPLLLLVGVGTWFFTLDLTKIAALFLVACADDMAVAIPLAITAAMGRAARQGVIIKGGEWFDVLSKVDTVVFDKTGTLTYGLLSVEEVVMIGKRSPKVFWSLIGSTEKFSEHSMARALRLKALEYTKELDDPKDIKVYKGAGVWASVSGHEVVVGNDSMMKKRKIVFTASQQKIIQQITNELKKTVLLVAIDRKYAGYIVVADTPRTEAKKSIDDLRALGIRHLVMMTGDVEQTAQAVAQTLGITEVMSSMKPGDKLGHLESLASDGRIAMVGDGVNDAPALARADVGIAMGVSGTAVAIEAADVVIVTDDLSRLPMAIRLARSTMSVIHADVAIWVITNVIGFALVLTGWAGPAAAALYNFLTDFIPLINSSRLFGKDNDVSS